jgi:hypothetical protein
MSCYYNGAGNHSLCYELYDKTRLSPDIATITNVAEEMVQSMGQKIEYYVNTTNLLSADMLYGEQPTSVYHGPKPLKMIINLNESSLSMSRFGFNADDEITGYVDYRSFEKAMSGDCIYDQLYQDIEPKSGDVFRMTEYGNDRINRRRGNFFQITQRRDQEVGGQMNPLGGHYGWEIKAKRMEYSWEPGLPNESANEQITDDTFYGKISSNIMGELSSPLKSYLDSADRDSVNLVIDRMDYNDTSVYGTYDLSEDPLPKNRAYTDGFYINGIFNKNYINNEPQLAQDNNKYYTFNKNIITLANGYYTNGVYVSGNLDISGIYNTSIPVQAQNPSGIGPYSDGYYKQIGTCDPISFIFVINDTYINLTPQKALDDNKYYVYTNGIATIAEGYYSNGSFVAGELDINGIYNTLTPVQAQDE